MSIALFGMTNMFPFEDMRITLQGTNMSLGKRKIIFKGALGGYMLVPKRVHCYHPVRGVFEHVFSG